MISPRLLAQIIKELLSVLRDPKSRFILIGPPVMQLIIFSFAATLEVRSVDIAVYDRDRGRWAQEFVSRVEAGGFVDHVVYADSAAAMHAMLDRRGVIAAIEIPQGFSGDVAAGNPAAIQVVIDGRRANAGQVTLGYLSTIAAALGADIAPRAAAPDAEVRNWFNPNLIYRWFVTPSLSGVMVTIIALMLTALSIARERELGTFDQLLVSPTTSTEIIIAKVAPGMIIGFLLGGVMILAAIFGFGIPFTGSALMLAGALLLFILSNVGFGLMISAICDTQQQAILGTFMAAVPMILMSGFATPVENIPVWLRWASELVPLKHFLIILQGTFLKDLPADVVFMSAWPMAAIATVTLGGAIVLVRSKLQ